MRSLKQQRHLARQRGSMSIVVVGMFLPLLFFLFSLSLDIATYYTDQAKVQAALDETALYAYRFLPNVEAARSATTSYAARFRGLAGLSMQISDSTVLLRVDRRSNLTFAALVGVRDATLPLSVVSRVRGAPVDSLVILDTSRDVAPQFGQSGWGTVGEWPAAQFFDNVGGVSARAKTQRCFNPIFSALKRTAIDAYRYLGASSVNSLGLGFYTGNNATSLIAARTVAPRPALPSVPGEVPFVGFADAYVGPSLCAAAAEREQVAVQYHFPLGAAGFAPRGDMSLRPAALIAPGTRSLDPYYAPYLQGEQLIWSQPSTDQSGSGFSAAFRESILHILAADRAAGRGGLIAKPARVLVWVGSQLPAEGGVTFGSAGDGAVRAGIQGAFAALAPSFGSTGLTIFYVVMHNPFTGFTPAPSTLEDLRTAIVNGARNAGVADGVVTARVFGVESPDALTNSLARWMALASKTSVVAQ